MNNPLPTTPDRRRTPIGGGGGGGGDRLADPFSAECTFQNGPGIVDSRPRYHQPQHFREIRPMAANDTDPAAADRPGLEGGGGGGGAAGGSPTKKAAWSRPANGVAEVGPVMGAASWPALSEAAARSSPKAVVPDASVVGPQGPVSALSLPKPVSNSYPNSNLMKNYSFPVRQRSMKRGDLRGLNGGNGPPLDQVENESNLYNQETMDSALPFQGAVLSRTSSTGNDRPRGSSRRGSNGPHSRGTGGHYKNNQNFQTDQDRGSREWNHPRNFSGRDVHMQQRQSRPVLRNFIRPPPNQPPFITPQGPYISPLGIPEMTSPVYYVHTSTPEPLGGITFIPPSRPPPSGPPTFLFPVVDPGLQMRLVKQIEYYFSADNLCKDIFLRQNMDEEGWVPISLIASFNRVKQIATNISVILDALQISTEVEVQGDKVRKRIDWMNWSLPPNTVPPAPGPFSPVPSGYDTLVTRFDGFTLDGSGIHAEDMQGNIMDTNTGVQLSRTSSEDSNHSFHNYQGVSRGATQAGDASLTSRPLNKTDSY